MVAASSPLERPTLRFSLRSLLLVLTLLSVWFALGATWGMHGLILPFRPVRCDQGSRKYNRKTAIVWYRCSQMTLSEFFVFGAMCWCSTDWQCPACQSSENAYSARLMSSMDR